MKLNVTASTGTVIKDYGSGILDRLKDGKKVSICRQCGRTLTDPASVEAGIGPECAEKEAAGIPAGD